MMASAGLLIGNLSAQPVVSIMGTCLGRGTIVSIILVLCVLPSILVLGDSIIERTRFKLPVPDIVPNTLSGTMRVRGRIRGRINAVVDADFDGILRGEMDAAINTAGEIIPEKSAEEGGQNNA